MPMIAMTVNNSTIDNNVAMGGGAIFNTDAAVLTLNETTLADNSAYEQGGAILDLGVVMVDNSTLSNNSVSYYLGIGGAISDDGLLSIYSSTISGNSAPAGGGVEESGGTLIVNDTTITGKSATTGGGIYNEDNATAFVTTNSR